jgi:hypothetical protein
MTNGRKITLREAVVRTDSIVGFYSATPTLREAVARTDVTKMELRVDTTPRWARIAWKVYQVDIMVVTAVTMVGGLALFGLPHPP